MRELFASEIQAIVDKNAELKRQNIHLKLVAEYYSNLEKGDAHDNGSYAKNKLELLGLVANRNEMK